MVGIPFRSPRRLRGLFASVLPSPFGALCDVRDLDSSAPRQGAQAHQAGVSTNASLVRGGVTCFTRPPRTVTTAIWLPRTHAIWAPLGDQAGEVLSSLLVSLARPVPDALIK